MIAEWESVQFVCFEKHLFTLDNPKGTVKGNLKLPNECCYLTAPWPRDSQIKVVPWTNDSALNRSVNSDERNLLK